MRPTRHPRPKPRREQVIHDTAGLLDAGTIRTVTLVGDRIAELTGSRLVVYAQHADDPGQSTTGARARDLLEAELADNPSAVDPGLLVLVEQDPSGSPHRDRLCRDARIPGAASRRTRSSRILADSVDPVLDAGDLNAATIVAVARPLMELSGELPGGPAADPGAPADAPPPGPPFPEPEIDRAVYDFAGVFEPETIAAVEETIDRIEERTKAEVVVYTQVVDSPTTEETERHARALIDQWGVGRKGFDDGLAIFFDFEPGRSSGQVQLYAAPGFAATFLTNSERQQIFENDMLPHLREDDWDGAILAAMDRIDEVATPENAARLEQGRQLNAVVGLVGAPLVLAGLVGWGFFHWRRYGKDPVYLDSPSIYVPAPPPDLTAASGAMVMDGGTSRRALTTAMLDLASRGLIAFREESVCSGSARRSASSSIRRRRIAVVEAQRERNSRRPIGPGGAARASMRLTPLEQGGQLHRTRRAARFGAPLTNSSRRSRSTSSARAGSREAPSKAVNRWVVRGVLAIVAGAGTGCVWPSRSR